MTAEGWLVVVDLQRVFGDPGSPWAAPRFGDARHRSAELAEAFGDRVVQHGALPKRDLYRLMATAGLYLYPPPAPVHPEFAETSCITAMEAMACGLPWISTDRGALPETVGGAGLLVPLNGACWRW